MNVEKKREDNIQQLEDMDRQSLVKQIRTQRDVEIIKIINKWYVDENTGIDRKTYLEINDFDIKDLENRIRKSKEAK